MHCVVCDGSGKLFTGFLLDVCPLCDGSIGWPDQRSQIEETTHSLLFRSDVGSGFVSVNDPFLPAVAEFRGHIMSAASWSKGPHEQSNWLIPGRVCVGSWPYMRAKPRKESKEDRIERLTEGEARLKALVDAGITTFVDLTGPRLLGTAPSESGLQSYISRAKQFGNHFRFLHEPMPDGQVGKFQQVDNLVKKIVRELERGGVVYIHCLGGHGRSGVISCCLLVRLFGLSAEHAKDIFNVLHATRQQQEGYGGLGGAGEFPHSRAQFDMVREIAGELQQSGLH